MTLYEFYYKYFVWKNKIGLSTKAVCLMVTPSFGANCADVTHPRHMDYARTCVVAFWRLMGTRRRHAAIDLAVEQRRIHAVDRRFLGQTVFEDPAEHAGAPQADRFLGVRDLVLKFDGKWDMALMEMLVDPLLCTWVPAWVLEQYERWNPCISARLSISWCRKASGRQRTTGACCGKQWGG